MAVDLGMGVDTEVTPSLHPQLVASLDEYDDQTSGELQQVLEAFKFAYEGVGKVHRAREAVRTDPTLTEAAQIVRTADHADKVFKDAAGRFDKVTANIKSGIATIERELTAPVQARAAHGISAEIRTYVRGLPGEKRNPMDFVRQAIEAGDVHSVSAVLGAPPYLSGLTPEAQQVLLRMHHERQNPLAAKKVRAMKGALDLLHEHAPKLHTELEKAVGKPHHEVRKLREARARSDKAFAS